MQEVIRLHRARRAIHILGEAREIGRGTEAARLHVVGRLLAELGATVGGAVRDDAFRIGGRRGCVQATLVGFDARTVEVYTAHDVRGSDFNPCLRGVMALRAAGDRRDVVSTTHLEVVSPRTWECSEWVNEYARPARVAHFLTSLRFVGADRCEGFGFMRAAGDRPFSEEDRSLLHLVRLECDSLFSAAEEPPENATPRRPPAPPLAPRARATLAWLLRGAADKEIAVELGISPHTVRQYVKSIYRAYGVASRAQLIARYGSLGG